VLKASRRTAPAVVDYDDVAGSYEEGMGASRGKDIAALALAGVASLAILVNALFLQSGPHPAPMFSPKPVAPRPVAPQPSAQNAAEGRVRAVGTELTGTAPQPRARPADIETAKPEAARSRLEVVADIQQELIRRGLYDGAADGAYGPKTDAAVREFERRNGVKLGGEPTEAMLHQIQQANAGAGAKPKPPVAVPHVDPIAALIAPTSSSSSSSAPSPAPSPAKRIVAVQRALADFGYGQIKATGTLDAPTQEAISRFERSKKMPVTGQVSPRLLRELSSLTGRVLE
jgi:peptidoglycan hydrolase-like protein with peptidoglycan-binding domain